MSKKESNYCAAFFDPARNKIAEFYLTQGEELDPEGVVHAGWRCLHTENKERVAYAHSLNLRTKITYRVVLDKRGEAAFTPLDFSC